MGFISSLPNHAGRHDAADVHTIGYLCYVAQSQLHEMGVIDNYFRRSVV